MGKPTMREHSSSYSSDEELDRRSASAVGGIMGKPTMRIPSHGDIAAVGASGGSASVEATSGSTELPFEEESQEGQLLGSLRAACREHKRGGGAPPIVPSRIFGRSPAAKRRDKSKSTRRRRSSTRTEAPSRPPKAGRRENAAALPPSSAVGGKSAVVRKLRPHRDVPREETAAVACESAVGGRPAVGGESAVGDSAVSPERIFEIKANLRSRTAADEEYGRRNNIGLHFNAKETQEFLCYPIFQDYSPLWTAVIAENRKEGSVQGCGEMAGEHAFFSFNAHNPGTLPTQLDRHYKRWSSGFRKWLADDPDHWKKLLQNVPGRPSASDKAGKILSPSPANEMLGMLAKFNWEYRRPSPNEFAFLDHWSKSRHVPTNDMLQTFRDSGDFHIDQDELRQTYPWSKKDVDWKEWGVGGGVDFCAWTGSSMIVPISLDASAVGERTYYLRSVTTICFPAFCFLLGQNFTAAEIAAAWVKLPLVTGTKKKRGNAGGRKRKATWGDYKSPKEWTW